MKSKIISNKGFTITELSVVILIIGLLIGATVSGADLLRNIRLKGVLAEVQEIKSAISQFDQVYEGLPGDITDATDYWSMSAVSGNGDGIVASEASSTASDESFESLNHLTRANLLDGTYTGTYSSAINPGTNVFTASLGKASGIYIKCCSNNSSHRDYDRGTSGLDINNHIAVFGIYVSDISKRDGIFTPNEAKDIDAKLDDGNPDTGFIGGSGGWNGSAYAATGCYTGSGTAASYEQDDDNEEGCQILFGYDWDD